MQQKKLLQKTNTETPHIIAEKLGRTAVSVKLTAQHPGCCKATSIPWTKAEEEVIRTQYACGAGIAQKMELLPGRTRNAIVFRAAKIGVVNARIWSEEEQQLLERYYPTMGTHIAEMMPGRTGAAVKAMAYNMAITFQGDEESRVRMWSEQERKLLDKNRYLSLTALAALFPGRSPTSVQQALVCLKARRTAGAE